MASIDSQSLAFENYIIYIDSLAELGTPISNYETVRQQTVNTLAMLAQTKKNIISQQESIHNNKLQDAKLINDIIVPDELPQWNTKKINELEILFSESKENLDVLRNNYQDIMNIAQQCPYAGGQAVFKARVLIALINDSILYDDDNVCLQSDIYRIGRTDSAQNNSNIISNVQLIPNPANNKVTVLILGIKEGVCKINIENILSQPVLSAMLDCKKQQHTLDISKLSVGVYYVKIELNNNKYSTVKLVIKR
ncbi:MAG: T9SS type A sorting domain-containing protein [Bacteroidia bacterium]|nr:T9SS type A sorting domain-containing protein [Bacteroidia bacterium]